LRSSLRVQNWKLPPIRCIVKKMLLCGNGERFAVYDIRQALQLQIQITDNQLFTIKKTPLF